MKGHPWCGLYEHVTFSEASGESLGKGTPTCFTEIVAEYRAWVSPHSLAEQLECAVTLNAHLQYQGRKRVK